MIRALIADDETLARRGLNLRLVDHEDVEVVAECRNGREAAEALETARADVAFLDIEMPDMSGVDVAASALDAGSPTLIVFVTAFDRYAIEAFEVAAIDYLVKPIMDERLTATLDRIRNVISQKQSVARNRKLLACLRRLTGNERLRADDVVKGRLEPEYLAFDDSGTRCRVPIGNIEYVEAAGDYMCIRSRNQTHIARTTLAQLASHLGPAGFVRIHRSTLVNVDRIREYRPNGCGDAVIRMSDGTELKCSRTYRARVQAAMDRSR